MFYKIVKLSVMLSFISSFVFAQAASAPAPSNAQLLKRIQKLESQAKILTDQNILIAKQINYFFDYQKENYTTFSDLDYRLNQIETSLNGSDGLINKTKSIHSTLNDSDGIICRVKQIEKDIYKYGSNFHAYEPICVTY